MFITMPDAELAYHSALFGQDGSKQWSYLELSLARAWFCVTVLHHEDDLTLRRTFLLSDTVQLEATQEMLGDALESVEVVLPTYMTGRESWVMKPLRAIWSGVAPDGSYRSVYVTTTGRRYVHYDGPLHERDLTSRRMVFRQRTQRADSK